MFKRGHVGRDTEVHFSLHFKAGVQYHIDFVSSFIIIIMGTIEYYTKSVPKLLIKFAGQMRYKTNRDKTNMTMWSDSEPNKCKRKSTAHTEAAIQQFL